MPGPYWTAGGRWIILAAEGLFWTLHRPNRASVCVRSCNLASSRVTDRAGCSSVMRNQPNAHMGHSRSPDNSRQQTTMGAGIRRQA